MSNKKELFGGLALGALGVATGGFGLLGAAPAAAGLGGAATGALGGTMAGAGTAGLFGAEAGSLGAGLLGAEAATPMMTAGLLAPVEAGMGGTAASSFGMPAVEALASDPAALSSPFDRFSAFMQGERGGKLGDAMGKMALQNASGGQQQPQNIQAAPPQPMQQPQQNAMLEDYKRRGLTPPFMAGSYV